MYYNLQLHCVLLAIADLQWVVKGALDVDIGANPSAEGGGEEDEGVDDQVVKVVDVVDTFRLQVSLQIFRCITLKLCQSRI